MNGLPGRRGHIKSDQISTHAAPGEFQHTIPRPSMHPHAAVAHGARLHEVTMCPNETRGTRMSVGLSSPTATTPRMHNPNPPGFANSIPTDNLPLLPSPPLLSRTQPPCLSLSPRWPDVSFRTDARREGKGSKDGGGTLPYIRRRSNKARKRTPKHQRGTPEPER